ncbi:glycosyltransferase [Streptomyces sp. AV19]|nr:glycosyltransferase [Streptomyces sp. AV19]MBH1936986.1 glycosyltransferase [Streptomyces sp. AV19]MDG4533040.1 glycosyltransferase [Streptomyces sp. AV19]
MRVAIVTESFPPDVGGAAHWVRQTVRHLERRGHEPLVLVPAGRRRGRCDDSAATEGWPGVVRTGGWRLAKALAAHRPDVVHVTAPRALGARGVAAGARLGVPVVAVRRAVPARPAGPAASLTLAPSVAAAHALTGRGVPRVRPWPPGVDPERFHPRHRDLELRRALAPGGELIVGYVGRLVPEKRLDLLEPVCALPGVRLVVTGDGPYAGVLRGVLPGARFLGCRTGSELARIHASLDVFVHPGPPGGSSLGVREALASGVPVIAPATGDPGDPVRHGRTGLHVGYGDAQALRDAVLTLEAGRGRRAEFGMAGREGVVGRTWEVVGDQLLGYYGEVGVSVG